MFVIGLSPRLADPEVLKRNEYFGKYGKIYKVVINNHTIYNGAQVSEDKMYKTVNCGPKVAQDNMLVVCSSVQGSFNSFYLRRVPV